MKVAGHRGNRLHAPENSRQAILSAYTSGADVLEFDIQLTKDNRLVVCHDGDIKDLTGEDGCILDMTVQELRHTAGKYDFSATFNPFKAPFRYYKPGRRLQVELFEQLINVLPRDVQWLIELKHDSDPDTGTRRRFVNAVFETLSSRSILDQAVVLYSKDEEIVRMIRADAPKTRVALLGDWESDPEAQLNRALEVGAQGLVTSLGNVMNTSGVLSIFAGILREAHESGRLSLGAILYPYRRPGVFTDNEFKALSGLAYVWSVLTNTMLGAEVLGKRVDVAGLIGAPQATIKESFNSTERDRDRFNFGYAKSNKFCEVFQNDGVRIKIDPYEPEPDQGIPPGQEGQYLRKIEERLWNAERNWPFYSGGGFGLSEPVMGDFIAEVDYEVENPMTQAVTLEMAAVNVDPGRHVDGYPESFREKDSFYDPHGCPPYVGVEHDEDDGYRINWNLGSEYDNNQYGPPVGDGATPKGGHLRLERRGNYFSAYYRNNIDAPDWICVGSVRNDSLNGSVFLRCVAKRWRQEDGAGGYFPIQTNTFIFSNFSVAMWDRRRAKQF